MTAAKVDGHAVIAEEPVPSPLSTAEKQVHFKRIRKLLLDDGSTTYGCTECDKTGVMGSIRQHLRIHTTRALKAEVRQARKAAEDAQPAADYGSLTVADLLNAGQQIEAMGAALEKVVADRDSWRTRAMKAERKLSDLKKVFAP